MNDKLDEKSICLSLKKLYDESEHRVKTNAIISRAYTDKISSETIEEKVNAQMNAIKIGIQEINPRFKEGHKNYDETKNAIVEAMANYEAALKELSDFYDGKIEQLIIRKVELEATLVGSIINEEYLSEKENRKRKQKDTDGVKLSISSTIKKAFDKIKTKKEEKQQVDVRFMENLQDGQDIENEIEVKLSNRIEKTVQDQKENKSAIEKLEKEIRLINEEIQKINERKKQSLYDAMEIGEKYLVSTIKKPRMFKKITRFFASRFNTPKVVQNTILSPLNQRIESFRNNELSSIKG